MPEFMSALVTEHFVLQSTSSATISESGGRVSIHLSALPSGLVAIGFASSKPHALASLAFTVPPTVFNDRPRQVGITLQGQRPGAAFTSGKISSN
jgi:hypothetical protein